MAELTANERKTLIQIENLDDPDKLKSLIDNARKQKSEVVVRAAFLRLCNIQPEANPGTVEHDVWKSIHALEEMKRAKRGKTIRLTRTRQKIDRDGEAKTVSDLVLKPKPSPGFNDLISLDHPELTFEAVVLRHPKTFPHVVESAARDRLQSVGVNPETFVISQ